MITRYSSRPASLYEQFLKKRLTGTRRYFRIAGYFRSSFLELAAEGLAAIPEVRILCNTEVSPDGLQKDRKGMLDDQKWDQDTVLQVISDQTKNPFTLKETTESLLRTGKKRPGC